MNPADRAAEWKQAYKLLKQTLSIDIGEQSRHNRRSLKDLIESTRASSKLGTFEERIRNGILNADLVLAHGAHHWPQISAYGWLLSDLGLEQEKLKKVSNTQITDRRTWGNHDFVFFYLGFRSHFANSPLAKTYGPIKLFDPADLYRKGWICLGDWLDYSNAQPERHVRTSPLGILTAEFRKPRAVADLVKRARKTRKHYMFDGREQTLPAATAVDELFDGPDIKAALADYLILILRGFRTPAVQLGTLQKAIDRPLPEYLLGRYLPVIEAKLPRAVSLKTFIEDAPTDGQSPAAATQKMLSHG